MPNTLFHASFAYKLGKELSCFTDDRSLNLYLLGSYGPDIFFYDRLPPTPFIPNQKHHGNLLHAAPSDKIACALLNHANSSLISYVYGFLTHIALDSTLHPYICSRTKGMDHTRFEGDIDSVIFHRYHDLISFDRVIVIPDEIDMIDQLITNVSHDTVNQTCPGAYKRSLKKLIRLYKIMYDPEAKRLHMINTFEKLFHKEGIISGFLTGPGHNFFDDCMNEKHMSWAPKFFPDEKRTDSVDELTMEAETLAINLINAAKRKDLASIIALCSERNMQDGPLPR
jgi:hypothetical protein